MAIKQGEMTSYGSTALLAEEDSTDDTVIEIEISKNSVGLVNSQDSEQSPSEHSSVTHRENPPNANNTKDEYFILELPRSILSAYILIHVNNDWNKYSFRGKIGIILAVAIPLSVQGLATTSLAVSLKWKELHIDTDPEELVYNVAALAALFMYMMNDVAALTNSTWYYLGRIEQEAHVLWNIHTIKDRLKSFTELKHAAQALNPQNWSLVTAQRNVNYLQFRIIIVATFVMYICLTFYGVMQMNLQKALVDKLDVALSIFIILQVDEWAYQLFIVQNRILEERELAIKLKIRHNRREHSIAKKEQALWYSILVVLLIVAVFVLVSAAYNFYELYIHL